MYFDSDEEALDLLYRYGHEEKRNGVLQLDYRMLSNDCRDAVNYLCDEWDFVVIGVDEEF